MSERGLRWLHEVPRGELLAALYDADHPVGDPRFRAERDYLLEVIGAPPRSVLELCSGTGRILSELARRGHEVTGVDHDPDALARSREKLARPGTAEAPGGPRLVAGDVLETDPGGPFDAALIPLNSIMCLATRRRQRSLIDRVRALLAPGGLFFLESLDPSAFGGAIASARAAHYPERVLTLGPARAVPYRKRQLCWGVDASGAERVLVHYELGPRWRVERRVSTEWRWRWLDREEVEGWLEEEGFETLEAREGFGGPGGYAILARAPA